MFTGLHVTAAKKGLTSAIASQALGEHKHTKSNVIGRNQPST